MPLTPADVHNVAFKKPPIGKRGYDEEEVDAFLDEVERELARLIEENNELRAQLERGGGGRASGPGGDPRLSAELAEMKSTLDRVQREKAAAEREYVTHDEPGDQRQEENVEQQVKHLQGDR
jgi:DivIVA domain-containing protein